MTTDEFKRSLFEVRNDATVALSSAIERGDHEAEQEARAVWHAVEIAIGMLDVGYLPKRAALFDLQGPAKALAAGPNGDC